MADLGFVRLTGATAWWFWGAAHVLLLVGARNRASVLLSWLWAYATYQVGVQLITGVEKEEAVQQAVTRLDVPTTKRRAVPSLGDRVE